MHMTPYVKEIGAQMTRDAVTVSYEGEQKVFADGNSASVNINTSWRARGIFAMACSDGG